MSDVAPGWYKDPADPTTQRYWDGEGWLGDPIPADATPPDGPPPAAAVPQPGTTPPTPADAGSGAAPAVGSPAVPSSPAAPSGPSGVSNPPAPGSPAPPGTPHPSSGPAAPGRPAGHNGTDGPGGAAGAGGPGGAATAGYAGPSGTPGQLGAPAPVPPPWTAPGGPLRPITLVPPPPPRPHGYRLAPYGSRLVARIIDVLAVLMLNVVVNSWFVYQWALEMAPLVRATLANPLADPQPAPARAQYLLYAILIIATALWLAYEVPALGNTGQTLGKRLMHIKVVRLEDTEPLGFGRAFRRWARLGMWTPLWACFGIGLLFQLIGSLSLLFDQPLRQALHDKVARTVVVEVPRGPLAAGHGAAGSSTTNGGTATGEGGAAPGDGGDAPGGGGVAKDNGN